MNDKKRLFKRGYQRKEKEAPIILDKQQEKAVHSRSSDILVIAGAGSGKTRVITERIKYLLETGTSPNNIVAITFTNTASEEMRERLSDVEGIGDTFIGTIHSFANKVMRVSGETYKIYDDSIENDFHRELIKKYCKSLTFDRFIAYKDLKNEALLGKISESVANDFLLPSERAELNLITRSPIEISNEIARVGSTDYPESVRTLCKDRNVITFAELLKKAEVYFRGINAKVEHVLVDEFQDVGTLEFNFIDSLQADNYFLVGDDWQSIYSFKGGNVNIFLKLIEDGMFEVHYLTNNYRNSSQILEVANIVINQVSNKVPKEITILSDKEGEVAVRSRRALPEVLYKIVSEGDYKDWFFLCRTNRDVFKLVEECQDYEIPCITFKREGMSLADMDKRMESNRVKILTVHTAKGLEIDNVLLYGNFPIHCPTYLNNEEERKVMYVGITRAKERLIIMN